MKTKFSVKMLVLVLIKKFQYITLVKCLWTIVKCLKLSLHQIHIRFRLGHSRLVVGYEEHHAKTRTRSLILFDPSTSKEQMQKLMRGKKTASSFSFLKKTPKQMKSKQYQLVYVDGLINEDEKEVQDVVLIHWN